MAEHRAAQWVHSIRSFALHILDISCAVLYHYHVGIICIVVQLLCVQAEINSDFDDGSNSGDVSIHRDESKITVMIQ